MKKLFEVTLDYDGEFDFRKEDILNCLTGVTCFRPSQHHGISVQEIKTEAPTMDAEAIEEIVSDMKDEQFFRGPIQNQAR